MTQAPEPQLATPWEIQLSTTLPVHPLALGALLWIALTTVLLGLQSALGFPVFEPAAAEGLIPLHPGAWVLFSLALWIGYTIGAFGYIAAGLTRDMRELYPADDLRVAWISQSPIDVLIKSRWAGAVGALLGPLLALILAWGGGYSPGELSSSEFALPSLMASAFFWLAARGAYFSLHGTREDVSFLEQDEIDLLNIRPLLRYGRRALRVSLVWIVGISLGIPLVLDFDFSAATLPVLAATLLLATATFVLPVRGVHRHIRQAKRAELATVESELRAVRQAALGGDARSQGRMSFLLDYRSYLDSVREWPFETSTLVRFGLYLLIPLGSWLAGALVERLVDTVLD